LLDKFQKYKKMRFKASVINQKMFLCIVQALAKVDKTGIIRLEKKKILFLAKQTDGENIQVRATIPTKAIFSELRIQSKQKDEIVLEIQLKNLLDTLKTATNALTIVTKLTKKHEVGYLSFEIKTQVAKGKESSIVTIVKDVPIRVLLQEETQIKLAEPNFSTYSDNPLTISLPKLKEMKSVVDNMKSTHNGNVEVSGSPTGQLRLVLNSTLVSIRTIYKGLNVKSGVHSNTELYTAEITVKLKSLSRFLHSHNCNPTDVYCIFFDNQALVIDVNLDSGIQDDEESKCYLTYYIAAVHE